MQVYFTWLHTEVKLPDMNTFFKASDVIVKQVVIWYQQQNFCSMNPEAQASMKSLYTAPDEAPDPMAGIQIALNALMLAEAFNDARFNDIAARAASTSSKAELRHILDEFSVCLRPKSLPAEPVKD